MDIVNGRIAEPTKVGPTSLACIFSLIFTLFLEPHSPSVYVPLAIVASRSSSAVVAEPRLRCQCKNGQCAGAMDLKHNRCLFKDKQMVRLQESPEDIPQGETPMTVNLCAFEDLVDVAKPGDRMEVTGIYRAQAMRVKATQKTLKSVYRTYIDVIHFKRTEKGRMGEAVAENEMGIFC